MIMTQQKVISLKKPCFVTERIPATLIVTREKSVTVSVEVLPNSK